MPVHIEVNADASPETKALAVSFMRAMDIVEAGYAAWAAKDHNKKWVGRIDGTPIKNDLLVNIAEAIVRETR